MIIKIDQKNPGIKDIEEVALTLQNGGLVIFPTETLYGLACLASNEKALKKIFSVKNRAPVKPLPVMVSSISEISGLVSEFPEKGKILAKRFWPGPLTLIMKSSPSLSPIITSGGNTVGIRIPDHQFTLRLLKQVGEPMAVTSANISEEENILLISDIIRHFEKKVDIIVDGGPLNYGIQSTVVDITKDNPVVLRKGKISEQEIGFVTRNA